MGQAIRVIRNKNKKPKGVIIDKRSIGTIRVGNRNYTYNPDKVATNRIDFDKIRREGRNSRKPRKVIYIVRK